MSEFHSSLPIRERLATSEAFKRLRQEFPLQAIKSLEQNLEIGDHNAVFATLTNLVENSELSDIFQIVQDILNIFKRDPDSDLAIEADQYWQELTANIHPTRTTRLDQAKRRFERKFGGEFGAAFEARRATFEGQGTLEKPYVFQQGSTITSHDAMYLSLTEHQGEPVFLKVISPKGTGSLFQFDGLNNEYFRILQGNEEKVSGFSVSSEPIETKHLAPPLDLLKLMQTERFQTFLNSLRQGLSGFGTLDKPFENKQLWSNQELSIILGWCESARTEHPTYILTNGVVLETDANFVSVRHIEGFAHPPKTMVDIAKAISSAQDYLAAKLRA